MSVSVQYYEILKIYDIKVLQAETSLDHEIYVCVRLMNGLQDLHFTYQQKDRQMFAELSRTIS